MNEHSGGKWPKTIPTLSKRQQEIKEDFMEYWHEVLPRRYGVYERFNHTYPLRALPNHSEKIVTLEIGCGLGEHIAYEDLSIQDYHAVDIRQVMVDRTRSRFPNSLLSG